METKQRTKKDTFLLELTPEERRTSKQQSFRPARSGGELFRMYKMRREPSSLEELDLENHKEMTIWCKNETLICIGDDAQYQYKVRSVRFGLDIPFSLTCSIYGKTAAAIAETLAFFCSLKDPIGSDVLLEFGDYGNMWGPSFDFGSIQPTQLAQILDANPARHFKFHVGTCTVEQSVILATRSHPMKLELTKDCWARAYFEMKDGGTAFVDALEKRESTFGSLSIHFDGNEKPFSRANLKHLLNLEILEKLSCHIEDEECALLPLLTNVNTLAYTVDAKYVQPHNFNLLNIVTKDLCLTLLRQKRFR